VRRPSDTTPAPGPRSILPGEVMPLREAGRRLGLAKQALIDAQKAGLKAVVVGRLKMTTGTWVLEFVERLAAEAGAGHGGHGQ